MIGKDHKKEIGKGLLDKMLADIDISRDEFRAVERWLSDANGESGTRA